MSRNVFLELCWEIEKLPASEQQTKCSVMASELYRDYTMVNDAIRRATLDEAIKRMKEDTITFSCLDGRCAAVDILLKMRDE